MISQDEARARVARGAAHLDQVRPGWFNEIDTGTLTLSRGCRCVVGQLNRGVFNVAAVGLPYFRLNADGTHDVITHGFALDIFTTELDGGTREACYAPLQDAWIAAIADRRLAASSAVVDAPESPMRGHQETAHPHGGDRGTSSSSASSLSAYLNAWVRDAQRAVQP